MGIIVFFVCIFEKIVGIHWFIDCSLRIKRHCMMRYTNTRRRLLLLLLLLHYTYDVEDIIIARLAVVFKSLCQKLERLVAVTLCYKIVGLVFCGHPVPSWTVDICVRHLLTNCQTKDETICRNCQFISVDKQYAKGPDTL